MRHVAALLAGVALALSATRAEAKVDKKDFGKTTEGTAVEQYVLINAKGMQAWRKRLFLTVAHNAASPVDYFRLPADRSVIMGAHVPV